MALQIQMAGVMPDILERAHFGGLERLGRKGWGYGKGKQKNNTALKEAWYIGGFEITGDFAKPTLFFCQFMQGEIHLVYVYLYRYKL